MSCPSFGRALASLRISIPLTLALQSRDMEHSSFSEVDRSFSELERFFSELATGLGIQVGCG